MLRRTEFVLRIKIVRSIRRRTPNSVKEITRQLGNLTFLGVPFWLDEP